MTAMAIPSVASIRQTIHRVLSVGSLQRNGARVQFKIVNFNQSTGVAYTDSGIALVDSGAELSVVSPKLTQNIGSKQIGQDILQGVGSPPITDYLYRVDLDIGKYGYVTDAVMIGQDLSSIGVNALIGRNILNQGFFYYDGANGTFDMLVGKAVQVAPTPTTGPQGALTYAAIGAMLLGAGVAAWGILSELEGGEVVG